MPAKRIECQRCHVIFLHKGQGVRKYCVECQVILYDERVHKHANAKKRILV